MADRRLPERPALWRTNASLAREEEAAALAARYAHASAQDILAALFTDIAPGRAAVVSSFGAESAVLLALTAEVDPAVPVVFLDTGKLFPETLAHRDALIARLGLTGVVTHTPKTADLAADDPRGDLHARQSDRCCHIRKTLPLLRALRGYEAWASGRKRGQNSLRATLPVFEVQDGRLKANPLAAWAPEEVQAELQRRRLPAHPLVAQNYLSIGCAPCTTPVQPGEDPRAGRWRGEEKTECGIHITPDGRIQRVPTAKS